MEKCPLCDQELSFGDSRNYSLICRDIQEIVLESHLTKVSHYSKMNIENFESFLYFPFYIENYESLSRLFKYELKQSKYNGDYYKLKFVKSFPRFNIKSQSELIDKIKVIITFL